MKKRGFTLIELLVVIAIIGVVIALVLPSLAGMRARAMFVACRSNLHQISVALHEYLNDYDCLPIVAAIDKVKNKKNDPDTGYPSLAVALYQYVETDKIFECPVDRGIETGLKSTGGKSCFKLWGSSYEFNSAMHYSYPGSGWFKADGKPKPVTRNYIANLRMPSELILMHDVTGDQLDARWHKVKPDPTYNVMFLDLHVEGMTVEGQPWSFEEKKRWWEYNKP